MIVSQIHSSKGADLAFNGLIILLYCEIVFSKARESIILCLAFELGIILFTAEVNLCKKLVKVSFGPCMTLVKDSVFLSYFFNSVSSIQLLELLDNINSESGHQIEIAFVH